MNTTSIMTEPTLIRELMPDNFIPRIQKMARADEMPTPSGQTISGVIKEERITSKYWKYVEILALEENPETYQARMKELRSARGLELDTE